MSRTDKTRPICVKVLDEPNMLVERHDHRLGPCDLGPKPTKKAALRWPSAAGSRRPDGTEEPRCFWWYSDIFWHIPANGCGCKMCTDQESRRAQRRKERHAGHRVAQAERRHAGEVARGAATSLSDVDDIRGMQDAWYDEWVEVFHNGFEAEVRDNARIAETLELPHGALVVGVDYLGNPYGAPGDPEAEERVAVTILHNDGTREVRRITETWDAFGDRQR